MRQRKGKRQKPQYAPFVGAHMDPLGIRKYWVVEEPVRIFVSGAYDDQKESRCPDDASRLRKRPMNL